MEDEKSQETGEDCEREEVRGIPAAPSTPPAPFARKEAEHIGFLTEVLDSIADPVCVKDRLHRWVFVNEGFCWFAGQKREALLGKSDYDFFPGGEADVFWQKDEEVFTSGRENTNEETITGSGGVTRTIVTKKRLYVGPSGQEYIVAIGRDVTAHKQIDEALKREKDKVQQYLDIAGVILLVIDEEQRVTMINRKGCEILGCPEEEILGKNWFESFLPEGTKKKVRSFFKKLLQGELDSLEYVESPVLTKDGDVRLIAWHNTILRNGEGKATGTLSSGEDITEKRRAEMELHEKGELLRQSQKLEAVGRLAGGIAHDFNNLLTAIIGFAELLRMSETLDAGQVLNIDEIRRAADRAANLTQQLLAFSRKQVLKPKVLNLNKLVAGIEKMLGRIIGENVQLITNLDAKLGLVKADPGQIEQVVMNLVVNARDSMPAGGLITVETKNLRLDEKYSSGRSGVVPGDYVRVAISDTGLGMDRATLDRIFEPFFTTKPKGKGTGLGLSTVYGIVKQSGGNIWVYSEEGKGTTFKIYLPRIEVNAEGGAGLTRTPVPEGGSELVLVVEDEDLVRKLICDSLKSFGYTALEAPSGGQAIEAWSGGNHPAPRLLITDVVMPEMSGKELADRLTAAHPEMKVLFISGYTENSIVHHGVLDRGIHFLEKPFSPQALAMKVREMLDTR